MNYYCDHHFAMKCTDMTDDKYGTELGEAICNQQLLLAATSWI